MALKIPGSKNIFGGGGATDATSPQKLIIEDEDVFIKGDLTIGSPDFKTTRAKGWFFDKVRDCAVKIETNKVNGSGQLEFYNDSATENFNMGIEPDGFGGDRFFIHSLSQVTNMIEIVGSGLWLNASVIMMPNIPAADPTNVGQLWNNGGVLTVSAG